MTWEQSLSRITSECALRVHVFAVFVFLHELNVLDMFCVDSYTEAERCFTSALERITSVQQEVVAEKWEPLLNNLGHVCRKLK